MAADAIRSLVLPAVDDPADGAAHDQLVRGALAGDAGAWSRLIERHTHRVVVSLLARGLPIDRARELAQETWLRLIESQRAGRLASLALPGLAIVQAGFLAANERRGLLPGGAVEGETLAAPGGSAEDRVIDRQQLDRVREALAACSPSARRVFEFVYDHPELTYAEASAQLGLSSQRVKQIVCEVRKRLRLSLEERR
jgi:DNA-directed RNA polymerase specialized sigma24 family protein